MAPRAWASGQLSARPSARSCARCTRKELCLSVMFCPPAAARDVLSWQYHKGIKGLFVLRKGHCKAVKRFPVLPPAYIKEVTCDD